MGLDQAEKNTIFVTFAPKSIYISQEGELLEKINKHNPNIFALNLFVPPPKGHRTRQNLGPIKITLVNRTMTNSCLKYGIKILDQIMIPRTVKQGQYLKSPQCAFCQKYHYPGHCGGYQSTYPHCGGDHRRFKCNNKQASPFCINCRGSHKATSNLCPTRKKLLTDDLIPDIIIDELINPFGPNIIRGSPSAYN